MRVSPVNPLATIVDVASVNKGPQQLARIPRQHGHASVQRADAATAGMAPNGEAWVHCRYRSLKRYRGLSRLQWINFQHFFWAVSASAQSPSHQRLDLWVVGRAIRRSNQGGFALASCGLTCCSFMNQRGSWAPTAIKTTSKPAPNAAVAGGEIFLGVFIGPPVRFVQNRPHPLILVFAASRRRWSALVWFKAPSLWAPYDTDRSARNLSRTT